MSENNEWNDIMDKDYFGKNFDTTKLFDRKIFVNQLGYLTGGSKCAVIALPCEVYSIYESGTNRFCGTYLAKHFGVDEASGDDVYIADFSSFCYPGKYYITSGDNSSFAFEIGDRSYTELKRDLLKAFYHLRCGEDLKPEHAGEYARPACHTEDAVLWEDHSVSWDVRGGWHDAGDYGRYVTPGATACAHLLYAYEMFPERFEDFDLNIPESGNGMPDILNECKVELEWIMSMMREDGGVYHKATTQFHAPFVMPHEDKAQMYLFPVSSIATADLAGVCALAYRIYKPFDEEFSRRLLAFALRSGDWLEKNPDFLFEYPKNHGTGGYGEWRDYDNRFWAWTELYLATDLPFFYNMMIASMDNPINYTDLGVGSVGGFGALSYILSGKEDELSARFKSDFIRQAERLSTLSEQSGWGVAMAPNHYGWGSNMTVGKNGMIFAIADYIEKSDRFKSYAQKQLDFVLGVNATGYSQVSGEGSFCINYPHLRSAHCDGIEKCMPGFVSGGANPHRQDHVAKQMIPEGTPPMKSFIDEVGSYSVNEITIYWNSPFVFLTGYLDE